MAHKGGIDVYKHYFTPPANLTEGYTSAELEESVVMDVEFDDAGPDWMVTLKARSTPTFPVPDLLMVPKSWDADIIDPPCLAYVGLINKLRGIGLGDAPQYP